MQNQSYGQWIDVGKARLPTNRFAPPQIASVPRQDIPVDIHPFWKRTKRRQNQKYKPTYHKQEETHFTTSFRLNDQMDDPFINLYFNKVNFNANLIV